MFDEVAPVGNAKPGISRRFDATTATAFTAPPLANPTTAIMILRHHRIGAIPSHDDAVIGTDQHGIAIRAGDAVTVEPEMPVADRGGKIVAVIAHQRKLDIAARARRGVGRDDHPARAVHRHRVDDRIAGGDVRDCVTDGRITRKGTHSLHEKLERCMSIP